MAREIGILDYGIGNIRSVYYAVEATGATPRLIDNWQDLARMPALILPGVGAFGRTATAFAKSGLQKPTLEAVVKGTPLLGICVGMQLLFEQSHEFGEHPGLGLLKGSVVRIPARKTEKTSGRLPVIGWFRTTDQPAERRGYYFLHSFAAVPADRDDVHQTYDYEGIEVTASVVRGNVMGTQYHPERSATDGLKLLGRFAVKGTIVPE